MKGHATYTVRRTRSGWTAVAKCECNDVFDGTGETANRAEDAAVTKLKKHVAHEMAVAAELAALLAEGGE